MIHAGPRLLRPTVLLVYLQAGQYGSALRAFEDIKAAGMQPNVVTYCSMISGLARSRQQRFVRSAYKLWRELERSGQHLDAAAYRTGKLGSSTLV